MRERILLLSVGVFVTTLTFVFSTYFGSFVTKADYNADKAAIMVIQSDIKYLTVGQQEIKELIKELR